MVGCFVPKCTSGHRRGEKCHLFRPSPQSAEQWIGVMKRLRVDRAFDPHNDNHRICSLHFDKSCIITDFTTIINGENVKIPRDRWTLEATAVPTIFNNLPSSVQPNVSKPRRALVRANHDSSGIPKAKNRKIQSSEQTAQQPSEDSHWTEGQMITMDDIVNWWSGIEEKKGWILNNSSGDCIFHLLFYDGITPVTKSIVVSFARADITTSVFINGRNISNFLFGKKFAPVTFDGMLDLMTKLGTLSCCSGIAGFSSILKCSGGRANDDRWFSINCENVGEFTVCVPCKLLHGKLSRLLNNVTPRNRKLTIRKSQKRLSYYKQTSARLRASHRVLRKEVLRLNTFIKTVEFETLDKKLSQVEMPFQLRETILTGLKSAKVKSMKGMRYSTSWLLECLLLRIKSPSAYNHLRDTKMIPLPHPTTLRKLIAGQPCEFGLNDAALASIKRTLVGKSRRDRQGVLIFDEIQLRETINYNHHTHRLDGFIDYGDDTDTLVKDDEKQLLANHALVIMYRPFNDSWVQPIAAFATRNAAKGYAIQKVVMQAIIKLEAMGAEVLSVVCDGSKPNKSFWKLSGIGLVNGEIKNKIHHPCDDKRFLYFTCDVPHLFKCIRNHCLKYGKFKFFGQDVDFGYYTKLLEEDNKRQFGLRKCPKLTKSHVRPNCFEKMVVSLATQLFSRSVATGLQFYRNLGVNDLHGSEGTQYFTQIMNDTFDALNTRFPKQGIRMSSPVYHSIRSFYSRLILVDSGKSIEDVKSCIHFASKETIIALKVTLKSTIEMIDFLLLELKYHYVLTAKMNQDCLEKFFGLIRAAGGREDHPTVSNFIQLFRLLSLYTPVRKALRGNVRTDEDIRVLQDMEKNFRQSAALKKTRDEDRKRIIDEIIVDKLLAVGHSLRTGGINVDNGSSSVFDENIIFHLAGFLCYRATSLLKCADCVSSLSVQRCNAMKNASYLTELLDYGALFYPSQVFFSIVCEWEKSVCKVISQGLTNGDIIMECVKGISNFSMNGLGCDKENHTEELVCLLLPYYVTMRVHFYTRSVRRALGKGKATKNKRKESKLLSK